jgi:hypothetical protein
MLLRTARFREVSTAAVGVRFPGGGQSAEHPTHSGMRKENTL